MEFFCEEGMCFINKLGVIVVILVVLMFILFFIVCMLVGMLGMSWKFFLFVILFWILCIVGYFFLIKFGWIVVIGG